MASSSTIPKTQLLVWWLIKFLSILGLLILIIGLVGLSEKKKWDLLIFSFCVIFIVMIAIFLYKERLFSVKKFLKLASDLNITILNRSKIYLRLFLPGFGYIVGSGYKYLIRGIYDSKIYVFAILERPFSTYKPISVHINNNEAHSLSYMTRTSSVNLFYPASFPYDLDIKLEITNHMKSNMEMCCEDSRIKKILEESAAEIKFLRGRVELNKEWVRLVIVGGSWEGKRFSENIHNGIIFFRKFIEKLASEYKFIEVKKEISFDKITGSFYIKGEELPYSKQKHKLMIRAILWTTTLTSAFLWAGIFLVGFSGFENGMIFLKLPSHTFLFIFSIFSLLFLSLIIFQQKELFKCKDFEHIAQKLGLSKILKETVRYYHIYKGNNDNIYCYGILDNGFPAEPINETFGRYKWTNILETERRSQINLFHLNSSPYKIDIELKGDALSKPKIKTECSEINEVVSNFIKDLDYFHWLIVFNEQWLHLVIIGGSWQGDLFARNIENGINMFKELVKKMEEKYPVKDWKDYKVSWDKKTWEFYLEKSEV